MKLGPFARQVEGDLRVVVGHDLPRGDVDDRGNGDPLGITGKAFLERLLEALDAQKRIEPVGIEVELPAAFVVGGAGDAHAQDAFESEQAPHDDRPVRPRTRPSDDEAVSSRLDVPAVAPVAGDAVFDVGGVADEFAGLIGKAPLHRPRT